MSGLQALLGARVGAVERWRRRRIEIEASIKALGERRKLLDHSLDVEKHKRAADIAVADARIDDCLSRLEVLSDQRREAGHRKCELRNMGGTRFQRFRSWLRAMLADGISLSEIDSQLEAVSAKIETQISQIEELSGGLSMARAEREKLGAPLDSLEFAISYLDQRATELNLQLEHLSGMRDQAIRESLLRARPDTLQLRLQALPQEDVRQIAEKVFKLKAAANRLAQLQILPPGRPSVPETSHTLTSAVAHGMTSRAEGGKGSLQVQGEGTQHIQKTRTVANASDNRGSSTETYWRRERVKLAGELTVNFEVETHGWRSNELRSALQLRAAQCFDAGVGKIHDRLANTVIPELATTIETLTHEIIEQLNAIDGSDETDEPAPAH